MAQITLLHGIGALDCFYGFYTSVFYVILRLGEFGIIIPGRGTLCVFVQYGTLYSIYGGRAPGRKGSRTDWWSDIISLLFSLLRQTDR